MSTPETRFYVELPADEDGNIALPRAVIEGWIGPGRTGRPKFFINAPPEVVPWSGYYADMWGGYAETEGPARMLSREEYNAIIGSLHSQNGGQP